MSVHASRSRLAALTRELSARWRETRDFWNDAKREEFERQYLQALFSNVEKGVTSLEHLEELMSKARKDCE